MASMGRKPTKNLNLPPRMRARDRRGVVWYYYDAGGKPRKEIPLGKDYTTAVRQWAELEGDQADAGNLVTFKDVSDKYIREVMPTKAARTMKDNLVELEWLLKFFNNPPAPLDSIKPEHVRQYLDWRGKTAKVRANREKALLSHIWNMARAWGITDRPNPCAGIKGFSEVGRDNYTEDDVLAAVWEAGDQPLRDALDLAYLTAQRPADVLSMSDLDIKDEILAVEQNKTGKKLRIEVIGELKALIDRIGERKKGYKVHTLALICTETGRALTANGLRSRFDKARELAVKNKPVLKAAIEAFQFRDLRAKAATDKAESGSMHEAQKQLGHTTITMTQHYVRDRKGETVKPTK
jgi:integrase